jgi:hypothetical protein
MENLTSHSLHNRTVPFRFLSSIPLSLEMQEQIYQIVMANNVIDSLPTANEVEIRIENQVPAGTELARAHEIWHQTYFPEVETPTNFPRQPDQQLCPANIVRLGIDCIERKNPGMGSFFGFTGYYLSVLVSLDIKSIWDVRGQQAT